MRENLTYGLMRGKRAKPSDLLYNYSVMFLLHKNAPRGCDQMQIAFQTYLCYTCTDGEFLQIMEESYGTKESDY